MMHTLTRIFKRIHIGDFGKVLIRFASSQVIANFMRLIAGFLIISSLDPEAYGLFTGVGVYLGYFALGHFGIINGLGREFPYQLGKGNEAYGRQLANSTFVITSVIGLLSASVFLGLACYHFIAQNTLLAFTFLTYVIIAGLDLFITQFFPVLYRTSSDFGKLSRQSIIIGFVNLITVTLVIKFGFTGLLIRGIILALTQFYLLFKNKPYSLTLKITKSDMIQLFKIGLPIYMVGQVNPLWSTILHNIIFSFGGAKYFGLYALSNVVLSSMNIIPQAFGQVIYPRMAIMYGKGTSPREIINLNLKPLLFQVFLMLAIAIAGVFILHWIIPTLLPKYIDGIGPAQWIMFVPVVISLGAINNIFNVTKQQKYYFISLISGAIIGTAFIYIRLIGTEFNLLIFPQGLLIGMLIQQISGIFFAYRLK
jgi:O-antigen/teichoic acid export membrane protein